MKDLALMAALFSFLAGCGGGGGDDLGGITSESYELVSFAVTGTGPDESGRAPINPGINGGNFSFEFSVADPSEPYTLRIYASINDNLSTNVDTLIAADDCIISHLPCATLETFEADCAFDNSNIIDCSGGETPVDLSDFFDELPQNAFLIIQTCEFPGLVCDTPHAHPVQFQ